MLRAEVKGQSAFHLAAASVSSLFIVMTPLHPPTTHWSALIHPPQEPLGLISQHHHLRHQWLDYLVGGLYLAAATESRQPSIKRRRRKKKNLSPCTKDFLRRLDFHVSSAVTNMTSSFWPSWLKCHVCFTNWKHFIPPNQPTTDGVWWELAARPWCTPHIGYNLLAPSTKAPC